MSRDGTPLAGDVLGWIPSGPRLTDTLVRAEQFALEQAHKSFSLEHLVLALADDTDAARVLEANGVDVLRLRDYTARYLGAIEERYPTGMEDGMLPRLDADLKRIFDVASAAAETSARGYIDGALIVAAIIGEGKSHAAVMLRQHGLNVEADDNPDIAPLPVPGEEGPVHMPAGPAAGTLDAHRLLSGDAPVSAGHDLQSRRMQPEHEASPDPRRARSAQPNQSHARTPGVPASGLPPIQRTRRKVRDDHVSRPLPAAKDVPQQPALRSIAVEQSGQQTDFPPAGTTAATTQPMSDTDEVDVSEPDVSVAGTLAQIDENSLKDILPAKMQVGVSEMIEIRILDSDIELLTGQFEGRDVAHAGARLVSRSLSLRLRSPSGSFLIEPRSPEVQWLDGSYGTNVGKSPDSDDATSWRWHVTAQNKGAARLRLIAVARTVTSDGTVLETALPEQVANLKIVLPLGRNIVRAIGWLALFAAGCALGVFARPAYRLIEEFLA